MAGTKPSSDAVYMLGARESDRTYDILLYIAIRYPISIDRRLAFGVRAGGCIGACLCFFYFF